MSFALRLPVVVVEVGRWRLGRFIGLDVHRDFCEVAISDGGPARSAGRVAARLEPLTVFAQSLDRTDRVVLEATGNAVAIARILAPHVEAVVLAHAKKVRAISHAKIKTDRLDARVLAELLAAGLVPAVWVPDEATRTLRRAGFPAPRHGEAPDADQERSPSGAASQLDRAAQGR